MKAISMLSKNRIDAERGKKVIPQITRTSSDRCRRYIDEEAGVAQIRSTGRAAQIGRKLEGAHSFGGKANQKSRRILWTPMKPADGWRRGACCRIRPARTSGSQKMSKVEEPITQNGGKKTSGRVSDAALYAITGTKC